MSFYNTAGRGPPTGYPRPGAVMGGPPPARGPPATAPGGVGPPPARGPPATAPGGVGPPPVPMMGGPPPATAPMGGPPRGPVSMMGGPPPPRGMMSGPPPPHAAPATAAPMYAAGGPPHAMAGPPPPRGMTGPPPPRGGPPATHMSAGGPPPPPGPAGGPPMSSGGPPPGTSAPPPSGMYSAGGVPGRPGYATFSAAGAPPTTGPPPTGGPPTGGPPTGGPPTGGPPTGFGAAPPTPAPNPVPMYAVPAGGAAGAASIAADNTPAAFGGGSYTPATGAPPSHAMFGAPGAATAAAAKVDESLLCSSKYMKLTVGAIPNTPSLATNSGLPLGLCVHPLARHPDLPEIPIVDFGSAGVVRCKRCRTYVNPFAVFVDGGRRWRCNMCAFVNEVPPSYFGPIDEAGKRKDAAEHAELSSGTVEFVAPVEYMVRPPQAPVYTFVLDVSFASVSTGALKVTCDAIKASLSRFPGGERTQIAFITYDSSVHFYNLRPGLKAPQMMVVTDIADLFLPSPEDLLVNLSEAMPLVEKLLDSLPKMHADSKTVDTCLGSALNAAFSVMQHIGGKMVVLQCSLPSLGRGKLKQRENPKLLGTDTEHTLLAPDPGPDAQFYKHKAVEFSRQQISVDSYLVGNTYMDVATVGCLSRYTAGNVHYYQDFNPTLDHPRLRADVEHNLTRVTGFEAVMRIRCTRGLRVTNFYGNFFIRGTDLLALPNVTQDTAFNVEIAHEEALSPGMVIGVQAALLYTTSSGERRICVHTLAAPVTSVLAEVFRNIDVDALCNLMSKLALDNMLRTAVSAARLYLHRTAVDIVRAFRLANTNAYAAGLPGQRPSKDAVPPLPKALEKLPLFAMALQKSVLFRGGTEVKSDERAALVYRMLTMPTASSKTFQYPLLLPLHNLKADDGRPRKPAADDADADAAAAAAAAETPGNPLKFAGPDRIQLPEPVNLAADRLVSDGVFLLYDGDLTYMWVGRAAPPPLLEALFGVATLDGVDVNTLTLPGLPNDYAQRIGAIINGLHYDVCHTPRVRIVREGMGDPAEVQFHRRLVEDRANFHGGAIAYPDYVAMVNRESQMAAPARS